MGGRLLRRTAAAGVGRGCAGGRLRGQGAGGGRGASAAAARGGVVSARVPLLPVIAGDVAAGRRSAAETVRAALAAIREADGRPEDGLNAFLSTGGDAVEEAAAAVEDRKSTRLNSSHVKI